MEISGEESTGIGRFDVKARVVRKRGMEGRKDDLHTDEAR